MFLTSCPDAAAADAAAADAASSPTSFGAKNRSFASGIGRRRRRRCQHRCRPETLDTVAPKQEEKLSGEEMCIERGAEFSPKSCRKAVTGH